MNFAKQCLDVLNSAGVRSPFAQEAMWRAAIVHYCKCFDKSGKIRIALPYQKYLADGLPRVNHRYFINLRNKHFVHDENAWVQASTGAIIGQADRATKVEDVICTVVIGATLNDTNYGNLYRLIAESLTWIESRFDQLCENIKAHLEAHSYEELVAQPDMTPYRAPLADEVAKGRKMG